MKKLFTMIRRGNLEEVAAILDKKPTRHSLTWTVDDTMTAKRIGTAGAKILSTPNMLALMEACAMPHTAKGSSRRAVSGARRQSTSMCGPCGRSGCA